MIYLMTRCCQCGCARDLILLVVVEDAYLERPEPTYSGTRCGVSATRLTNVNIEPTQGRHSWIFAGRQDCCPLQKQTLFAQLS